MTTAYGTGPRGKATRLHAQIVRARGTCENDWSTTQHSGQLQCAHIISRRYASTRTDLDNAYCLCAACHRYFEEAPLEFAKFVYATIGETKYEELRKKSLGIKKVDWVVETARLNAIWKVLVAA